MTTIMTQEMDMTEEHYKISGVNEENEQEYVTLGDLKADVETEEIQTQYGYESEPVFNSIGESDEVLVVAQDGATASEHLEIPATHSKSAANQHTIGAITGLSQTIADITKLKDTVYAKNKNVADYYLWNDNNESNEDRHGLFAYINQSGKAEVCTSTSAIFGVVVGDSDGNGAGFVGGQDDIQRGDRYAQIVYDGIVNVRCELDVVAGDYVVCNNHGVAEKNEYDYGYKVLSISDIKGVRFASISLSASSLESQVADIGGNVESLTGRMRNAEANITSAIGTANEAIQQAQSIGVANNDMQNQVAQMSLIVDNMSDTVDIFSNSAAEALRLSNEAIETTTNMYRDAMHTVNDAFAASTNAQEYAQSLVAKIDKYCVGEYSQANGLTEEQAASIMKPGMVYVPTSEHDENLPYSFHFVEGYSYIWKDNVRENNQNGWLERPNSVVFSADVPIATSQASLWYSNTDEQIVIDGRAYEPHTLYEWDGHSWVGVASRIGNATARSVNLIVQKTNEISMMIGGSGGSSTSLTSRISDQGAQIAAVAALTTESQITVKGILDTAVAPAGAINGDYFAVGTEPPYEVYQYDGHQLVKVLNASSDGVKVWKVNAASIISSVNNDGTSSLNLNASKINFTGYSTFLNVNGDGKITSIDGGYIKTGTVDTARLNVSGIISAINSNGTTTINGGKITTGSITASQLAVDAVKSSDYSWADGACQKGTKIDLSNGAIYSKNFKIDSNGNVSANNITLTGGVISSAEFYWDPDLNKCTVGSRLRLDTGAFYSPNFNIYQNGNVSANNLSLRGNATISGSLTVLGGSNLTLQGNSSINCGDSGTIYLGGVGVTNWNQVARFG